MKRSVLFIALLSAVAFVSCITVTGVTFKGQGPAYLSGIKKIDVEFDYSGTSVGKFANEEDYVNEKVAEMNEDEAGKGDNWKEKWNSQKEFVFAPKFIKSFAKKMEKKNIDIGVGLSDADLKIVVHIVKMEPGFNIGITSKDAYISIQAKIYKTSDLETPVDVFEKQTIKGTTNDDFTYDVQKRLASAYENAGKDLGAHLTK